MGVCSASQQGEPIVVEHNHFGNRGAGGTDVTGLGGASMETCYLTVVFEAELELKTGSAKLKE